MTARQLASTPHKPAEIMKMGTRRLVANLEDPGVGEFAKAKACQRLAVVGMYCMAKQLLN